MPKISRQKAGTYVADFDFNGGNDLAATLNMYCSHRNGEALESFPGFRSLAKLNSTMNGFYHLDELKDTYLVHAGAALYECIFINQYKDVISRRKLCDMADKASFAYRISNKIYIVDGEDITVVDENTIAKKLSENPDLAYVPTTYINGEEAEQVNILSDLFKEETRGVMRDDFAFGSDELIYEIKSERDGTCAVRGSGNVSSGRIDIPSRKMIGGRYYTVEEISDGAFKNLSGINTVVMSPSVKRVGVQAFSGCSDLKCVVMPDGIEEIDSSAFAGCSSLINIYLGATCKKICYNAFDNCSNIENVYISGNDEDISKCDGIGIMFNYTITYQIKYKDFYIGVPIFTPARSISQVLINGIAADYTYSKKSGMVKISCSTNENLEGADIVISGTIDRGAVLNSERKTPISLLLGSSAENAILSSTGAVVFDGRALLYGTSNAKSMVFTSSKPMSGDTDLIYFGELDYFAVGSAEYKINDIKTAAKYIIITKRDEMGGSIFVYTPKGAADAAFGRSYEMLYKRVRLGIKSNVTIYNWMAHYATDNGIYRMKLSTSEPTIERVSDEGIFKGSQSCPALEELEHELYEKGESYEGSEIIIDTFSGFLAVIKGDKLFLGDSRLTHKSRDGKSYAWFTINDFGTYTEEQLKYCYAETAPAGYYIHPNTGEKCNGTVYSIKDEEQNTIYYTKIGNRRYSVVPTRECYGGVFSPVKTVLPRGETMLFATEQSQICALKTDKVGIPPQIIYEAEDFDANEYKKAFGHVIHPIFYAHVKRSVLCAIVTEDFDGNAPYVNKRSLHGGTSARLKKRSCGPICFASIEDGTSPKKLCEVPMGDLDFSDFNFALLSMNEKISETISILDSQEKWVNKQIVIYTFDIKSPFIIEGINLSFRIASQIRND